jgi:hypothetical protein
MNHPDASLLDYVDGTLAPAERAKIDAHLAGCLRCSEQVRAMAAAGAAIDALESADPPAGLANAALAEAERMAAERAPEVRPIGAGGGKRTRTATPRWLAVAGAVAAVALVVAVAPKLGQSGGSSSFQAAGAASDANRYAQATAVEVQDADYGDPDVQRAALAYAAADANAAADATGGPAAASSEGSTSTSDGTFDDAATTRKLAPQLLAPATNCLDAAFDHPEGTLNRVIQARYNGTRAYLGLYLIGPGAGLPPDAVRVLIASVKHCTILSSTQAQI